MNRLKLSSLVSPEDLATEVSQYEKLLFMTDYDGTLVPIAQTPELAVASPELIQLLGKLVAQPRVVFAVISGRDLRELATLLPLLGSYLIGCHGSQCQFPTGVQQQLFNSNRLQDILQLLGEQAHRCIDNNQGFLVETKASGVALHYRLADPLITAQVLDQFTKLVEPWLTRYQLELMTGKKVVEVRPQGVHKGVAVQHLIKQHPGYYPIYIGDDTTDEDAFAVLREMGLGILISNSNRETFAAYRLFQQADLLKFLQILLARC